MDTTRISSSYENATYLDYVESPYENVTNLDYVENHVPGMVYNDSSVPVWLIILMISISTWIIMANGLVFVCLVTSRNALKNNVNIQLLSLCITDMLVGIITIPAALMPMFILFTTYESCAFVVYIYFVAQSATLCHTLLICVNRLLTIKRKSNVNESNNGTFKSILKQILAVWTGCLLFSSIHFLAFAQFGETVVHCSTVYLFQDNHLVATGLLAIPLLVPPQLCTDFIYVYLFIYVTKRLRSVHVVHVKPNHSPDDARPNTNRGQEKLSQNFKPLGDVRNNHRLMIPSVSEVTKGPVGCIGYTQTRVRSMNVTEVGTSTVSESKCYGDDTLDRKLQETAPNTTGLNIRAKGDSGNERNRTNNNRLGLEKQRRVLVTFGILLISLNVFMTPLDFLTIIEMFNNGPLSRGLRFIFMTMAMLNSALNPVINSWRIKPFRVIMREKLTKMYELLSFQRT